MINLFKKKNNERRLLRKYSSRSPCENSHYAFHPFHLTTHITPGSPLSTVRIAASDKYFVCFSMWEQKLWVYNVVRRTWTKHSFSSRYFPEYWSCDKTLLVNNNIFHYTYEHLLSFDIQAGFWKMREKFYGGADNTPLHIKIVLAPDSGVLYALLAIRLNHALEVRKLNKTESNWEKIENLNAMPSHSKSYKGLNVAVWREKLYIIDGQGNSFADTESISFCRIPTLDLQSQLWGRSRVFFSPSPAPRKNYSFLQFQQWMLVSGGIHQTTIFKDIWRMNLDKAEPLLWERLGVELAVPTFFHASCATPSGKMFIFGGLTRSPGSTRCEMSQGLYSMWIIIPTLKKLCWDAVISYFCHIPSSLLLKYGAPKSIMKRIIDICN